MFGIINIIGNFGTVFVDQSYWQSAIAAKPAVAHKGYLLGGMVWFTIPLAVVDGIFHTNLCEYYNPETSKQHKLHTAAAAAEPAKAAEPVS